MVTNTTPNCPDCGAPTRERKSNKPGVARWFPCTRYPACKGAVREFAADLAKLEGDWKKAEVKPAIERVPAKPFTASKYQEAIFAFIKDPTKRHGVVEAVAGSGKTTTLVKALECAKGKVIFTAFNAAIAKELEKRAPAHVTVSTLHSLGLRATRKAFPQATIDKDGAKVDGACEATFPVSPNATDGDPNRGARQALKKLISLAKATLVNASDVTAVNDMADRYGVDCDSADELAAAIRELPRVMADLAYNTSWIDFDDMIWFPTVHNLAVDKYDWVFIDETQDLNRAQVELALKACSASGRIIAVGDRYQSIYGFRGADCEAMPRMVERLSATVLPLSITYRCPLSHVAMAKSLVPHLEARPGAPEGVISTLELDKALEVMKAGDLVMCRKNAPLVEVAFSLIRAGKKAIVRGRELGTGLMSLIRKLAHKDLSTTVAVVLERLQAYQDKEREKLVKMKKATTALDDKCETIRVLSEGCDNAQCLIEKISMIFSDTDAGIVCSSIHRAKGFEADRTFIVDPGKMPPAKKDWEKEQERNVEYVSLTRSKSEMTFVSRPEKK